MNILYKCFRNGSLAIQKTHVAKLDGSTFVWSQQRRFWSRGLKILMKRFREILTVKIDWICLIVKFLSIVIMVIIRVTMMIGVFRRGKHPIGSVPKILEVKNSGLYTYVALSRVFFAQPSFSHVQRRSRGRLHVQSYSIHNILYYNIV